LKSDLLRNTAEFNSITLNDVFFENVTVSSSKSLITFENINHYYFSNHTYSLVTLSDTEFATTTSLIRISSLKVDNSIQELLFSVLL
jgi:hypothetical protein